MSEHELRSAIDALMAEFCWRIDRNRGEGVADLFMAEGRLIVPATDGPDQIYAGREAIAARWRDRPPGLVSRHIYTNLRVERRSPREAHASSVGLGYRHEGPGRGATIPLVVSDFDDILALDERDCWRFRERRITLVFADPAFGG
jgi:SnoaL-like protein